MTFSVLLVYIGVVCVAFAGGCDAVAPVIDDVQPSYGSIGGGTLVTISGKNLMPEMKSSSDPFKSAGYVTLVDEKQKPIFSFFAGNDGRLGVYVGDSSVSAVSDPLYYCDSWSK